MVEQMESYRRERKQHRELRGCVALALSLGRAYEKAARREPRDYDRMILIERAYQAYGAARPDLMHWDGLFIRGRNSVRAALGAEPVYY